MNRRTSRQYGVSSNSGKKANKASYSNLATITLQQGADHGDECSTRTVAKVELQNEDGYLVYNVVIVFREKKVQEIKVDSGNGSIFRMDVDSAERETGQEERAG